MHKALKIDPDCKTMVYAGSKYYVTDEMGDVVKMFDDLAFANLTAPGGSALAINAKAVIDRDDATPGVMDHPDARSVLYFAERSKPPNARVRETKAQLIKIWTDIGLEDMIHVLD
jgi:hypothetical protein